MAHCTCEGKLLRPQGRPKKQASNLISPVSGSSQSIQSIVGSEARRTGSRRFRHESVTSISYVEENSMEEEDSRVDLGAPLDSPAATLKDFKSAYPNCPVSFFPSIAKREDENCVMSSLELLVCERL